MNTINVFFYKGIMNNVAVKVFCFKHIFYSKYIPLNATAFLVDPLPACLPVKFLWTGKSRPNDLAGRASRTGA